MCFRRRAVQAFLSCVFAAGVAAGSSGLAAAQGLSGAYLAGKHAANLSDIDAAARYFADALERDPDNLSLMEQALLFQTAANKVDAAIELARKVEKIAPTHRSAALLLTAERFKAGDFEGAEARLDDAPESYHALVGAMLKAWAAHGLGAQDEADAAFAGLGDQAVFQIFGGYHRGLMRHAAGDLEGAVAAFGEATDKMSAPTGRMARAYGAALRATGETETAAKIYADAMSVAVGDAALEIAIESLEAGEPARKLVSTPQEGAAEALYGLAAALGRDGEEHLSLFYTRIATYLRSDFYDGELLAAELLEAEEQYDLAIAAYERIPTHDPLSRAAEIGRADALRLMGEEDQAVEALKNLTRRSPNAIDAHIALGDLMRRTSRFAEGAVAYDAAIKLMEAAGRPSWVLYYERGICYERSGQWDLAEADFFRALEMKPDQPLVLNYLGYSWLEAGENYEQAIDMIAKAVEQRPEDGYIVDSLGWGYYRVGDFPAAVRELERAVALRPIDPVINDHLGDALWQVGRKREAEFQWKRALSFDPDEDKIGRIVRKLEVGLDKVLAAETKAEIDGAEAGAATSANDG